MLAALSDRRDLTENLPFRFEPIIERRSIPVPSLTVELIGPLCDQDMQVFAWRQRQYVKFLRRRFLGICCCCWGAGAFRSGFVERMLTDFMSVSFLGLYELCTHGQHTLRGSHREGDEWTIETSQGEGRSPIDPS